MAVSDTDWTVVLSGPLAQRQVVLAALDRAGLRLEGADSHRGVFYGLPDSDPSVGWVGARHRDVNEVVDVAKRAGWTLRLHWPTPDCRACGGTGRVNGPTGISSCLHCQGTGRTNKPLPSPEQAAADAIAALEARIADLEGRA